jgi:esterase/lipase superfamily enzyme
LYIITNRRIKSNVGSYEIFDYILNPRGIRELRLIKYLGDDKFRLLEDKLSQNKVQSIKNEFQLDIDVNDTYYSSLEVASDIFKKARDENKQILVSVHGYNNDMKDVIERSRKIEDLYNVVVIIFSWPSNGDVFGYLDDKDDARASTGAFNKFLHLVSYYHQLFTSGQTKLLQQKAIEKNKQNQEKSRIDYVKLQNKICKTSINLVCHSMGNYLLKYTMIPSENRALSKPIFDNICLVAADTNNKNHKDWVEKIEVGSNLYIVINENDSALKWSRRKPGEEQLARLGHHLKSLNAQNATYIDVTDYDGMDDSHAYFVDVADTNDDLEKLFSDIFTGKKAEKGLKYYSSTNSYGI